MGILVRIGELIKVFANPQEEMQDEEISIDKLEKLAKVSGMSDKEISELSKNYQSLDKKANEFEIRIKESAKIKKNDSEEKITEIKTKRNINRETNIQKNEIGER